MKRYEAEPQSNVRNNVPKVPDDFLGLAWAHGEAPRREKYGSDCEYLQAILDEVLWRIEQLDQQLNDCRRGTGFYEHSSEDLRKERRLLEARIKELEQQASYLRENMLNICSQ